MLNQRANDMLASATYLRFRKREKQTLTVGRLHDKAILTLFQLLGILDSEEEDSLVNLGLKFNKSGVCRVRLGENVIITIPDAGSRKEFQAKLINRWTHNGHYMWYSEEDKLELLKDMEFSITDGLISKHPLREVITESHDEVEESLDDEPTPIGVVGMSPALRGSNKSALAAAALTAAMVASSRNARTYQQVSDDYAKSRERHDDDLPW